MIAPPSPAGLAAAETGGSRPWAGHPLFSLEGLYRAYRSCRRGKRSTWGAVDFETRLEDELVSLHEELETGSYQPRPFLAFLVSKPKRREIFAAEFRDRVVHHLLSARLEPRWEKRFIHDSYACRKGKGTHAAVDRLQSFQRRVTANGTRPAWYLQLDVKGFFVAIDRQILYSHLEKLERDPAVLWLVRTILFQDPTLGCRLRRSQPAEFQGLPAHKTLFHARPGCGLPIGNLTSQLFANIYLDVLDQHVKHVLRAPFYLRYCDDLVLLSEDREELERWERDLEAFLGEALNLVLNERTRLRPVSDGVDFLGYVTRPDYLLPRRRVVGALKDRLERTGPGLTGARAELVAVERWLGSYLAHLARASSRRLVASLRRCHPWLDRHFQFRPALRLRRVAGSLRAHLRARRGARRGSFSAPLTFHPSFRPQRPTGEFA